MHTYYYYYVIDLEGRQFLQYRTKPQLIQILVNATRF